MKKKKELVKQLSELILRGNAHASFEDAVANVPKALRSKTPDGLPYNLWQLVEHIRIAQWDILEFSRNPEHKSPKWPAGYWSKSAAPKKDKDWNASIKQVISNRDEFLAILGDKDADLYTPFAHGDGQNLLREALLIADHASYHIGQIILVRRLLGDWK